MPELAKEVSSTLDENYFKDRKIVNQLVDRFGQESVQVAKILDKLFTGSDLIDLEFSDFDKQDLDLVLNNISKFEKLVYSEKSKVLDELENNDFVFGVLYSCLKNKKIAQVFVANHELVIQLFAQIYDSYPRSEGILHIDSMNGASFAELIYRLGFVEFESYLAGKLSLEQLVRKQLIKSL